MDDPDGVIALEVLRQLIAKGNLLWQGGPGTTWVSIETDRIDVGPAGAELLRRLAAETGAPGT